MYEMCWKQKWVQFYELLKIVKFWSSKISFLDQDFKRPQLQENQLNLIII